VSRVATLSVGDELVLGQIVDTNAAWLGDRLAACGRFRDEHRLVADDRAAIARAIRELSAGRSHLIVTGGLGPTLDDLTREGLNAAIDASDPPLVADEVARGDLDRWFAGRGRSMPEINLRQAMRPSSARCLRNPNGTAPGLAAELDGCRIWCLPGPPREMEPMFEAEVAPALAGSGRAVVRRAVLSFGLGESALAERLGPLMDRDRSPSVGTTASGSIVTARIRAEGEPESATATADATARLVETAWEPYAFGRDGTIAEALARELSRSSATVAVAESCTGGSLGGMLTSVAGSSAWFPGGIIAYANDVKIRELSVPAATIDRAGAVSDAVAVAMAAGVRTRFAATYGVGITGIAGPGGGSDAKPVGLVWIGLAGPDGSRARAFRFPGDRATVRDRAAKSAIQWLRFRLLGRDDLPLIWDWPEARREAGG
jgi:nicotinamide-nucleotide amidase